VQASHGYVGGGWRTWRRLGGSLSLVEGALELGVGVGTGRKELHLGLLTSIVTMFNKEIKIYDNTIKLVFAIGSSSAATEYIMR
jgi:hypothetical protein